MRLVLRGFTLFIASLCLKRIGTEMIGCEAVPKQKAIINAAAGGSSFTILWMVAHYFIDKDISMLAGLLGGAFWIIGSLIVSSFKQAK
ncbi:hypothetical protein [Paenibacillus tyrfis]|uniref:Uncharacterized protein n=1 Tax=Paenibacillus tyrfis TaxID=1501230 RepID=A0A081P206_9BACL|nr:hypothetical protein [Paenibacillus tyrfis]KEQ24729.1 hypothetical protein ET33_06515 [Paenibacillus tyrfis]